MAEWLPKCRKRPWLAGGCCLSGFAVASMLWTWVATYPFQLAARPAPTLTGAKRAGKVPSAITDLTTYPQQLAMPTVTAAERAGKVPSAIVDLTTYPQQVPAPPSPLQKKGFTVTAAERAGKVPCSFLSEKGEPALCNTETPEHELVERHLPLDATVLEFGGRYGTTSCQIAAKQHNSGKLLTVEPDRLVWKALERNIAAHKCNVSYFPGIIGTVARTVSPWGYGTRTVEQAGASLEATKTLSFHEAELLQGLKFDTLLIDCEGCVDNLLKENPGMLNNIRLILMEGDMGHYKGVRAPDCGSTCIDYNVVIARLTQMGFKVIETFKEGQPGREGKRDCCPWIYHWALWRDLRERA